MGRARLDLTAPPTLTAEEVERLDAMSSDEIERNAMADADNPPLTPDELDRISMARENSREG